MGEFYGSVSDLLLVAVIGYLLGSLPLAYQISRHHGVDIFQTGPGLAGANNVYRAVGLVPAALVVIGDAGKGALIVLIGRLLGIGGVCILIPAAAVILGHWNSIFTRFRGGDGLVTLGGVTLALFQVSGLISIAVGIIVALGGQKLPYSSLLCIVFSYATLVALSLTTNVDAPLALGFGGLTGLVLSHAILGHRRRRHATETQWQESDETEAEVTPDQSSYQH